MSSQCGQNVISPKQNKLHMYMPRILSARKKKANVRRGERERENFLAFLAPIKIPFKFAAIFSHKRQSSHFSQYTLVYLSQFPFCFFTFRGVIRGWIVYMAKSKKLQSRVDSRCHGASLHKLSSRCKKVCGDAHHGKLQVKASEKKEWEDAVCSVCLEFPHNAVLLLCSSYENGCRPYMCATSHRYSNCLEQYRKTYTRVASNQNTQSWQGSTDDMDFSEESGWPDGKSEMSELMCPLCRGQVKGWTVVEPARRYLNAKKRTCTQDNCSFVGTYKEIRKHVKLEHPLACPRDVDPSHAEKWKKLENERDLSDVFSTIRSTMPGAIVLGDYVIEGNYHGMSGDYDDDDDDGYLDNALFRFPTYGGSWNGPPFSPDSFEGDYDALDEEYFHRLQVRATLASRSNGRNVSRIARPHARFLFARHARRFRERR